MIRVGVPYSKTLYYTVKGVQWGVAYEGGQAFEKYLNRKYPQGNKNLKIHLMYFVAPRQKVVERLNEGTLDLLVAGLTITPERQKVVDFSSRDLWCARTDRALARLSRDVPAALAHCAGPSDVALASQLPWITASCASLKASAIRRTCGPVRWNSSSCKPTDRGS